MLTFCTISVTLSTAFVSGSWNFLYTAIPTSSAAELNSFKAPARLSLLIFAASAAVPLALRSSSSYWATLSTPSFKIRLTPFKESAVNTELNAVARCASPMPSVAVATSVKISVMSRKLPFESCTAMLVLPIVIAPFFILAVRSRIIAASCVPARLPFVPWFAIASSSAVVVSKSCPDAFMFAAQF